MHLRRLLIWWLLAGLAALPEALIVGSEPAVGFQVWLVLQLLGVIFAAITVAALFSVVGLGLVRLVTWPVRDRPSTFVAWSFLRASRLQDPAVIRVFRAIRDAVDAGPLAPGGLRWAVALVGAVCAGLGAAAVAMALSLTSDSASDALAVAPTLLLRNIGGATFLHGGFLLSAALPWRPLRWALPLALTLLPLALLALLDRLPEAGAPLALQGLGPAWVRLLPLGIGALALWQVLRRPRLGRDVLARRVGLLLLPLAVTAGVFASANGGGLWGAQAGGILGAFVLALLLHGAARVSVPVFVAIVGVAAGTWALIVVLSVMGGFAADLRAKMLVANAHALVERPGGADAISGAARLSAALRGVPGVAAVSPQVRGDAILGSAFNVHNFVSLRGIDPALAEVQRGVGSTVVTGALALLASPEAMGQTAWRGHRVAAEASSLDLPSAATAGSASADPTEGGAAQVPNVRGVEDQDIDALLQMAPGPAEPTPPRPPIALPSTGLGPPRGALAPVAAMAESEGPGGAGASAADAPDPASPTSDPDARIDGLLGLPPTTLDAKGATGPTLGDPSSSGFFDLPLGDEDRDVPVAPGILLGVELARSLQVDLGDRVEVITPDADVGPTGLRPRLRSFRVAGTFETGLYEADSKVAYIDVAEASRYFNMEGDVNVIELRLFAPAEPDEALASVRSALRATEAELAAEARARGPAMGDSGPPPLRVVDWRELNRSLFSALAFERLVIFLVLGLIILVASFAIVSALTMVILQKRSGIAMLAAMGGSPRLIANAFVQMGFVIGAIGTSAGLILGLSTCALIATLGIQLPEAYYVRELPVQVVPLEVATVVLAALAVSLVATAFPARTAARSRPLDGLRQD